MEHRLPMARAWLAFGALLPLGVAQAQTAALLPLGLVQTQAAAPDAQDTVGRQTITVQPRVAITETLTSNVGLTATNPQSDLVTTLSPGINVNLQGAHVKGFLDYTANGSTYANTASSQQVLNQLNSVATVEAINNTAFIDFSGSIGQQSASAFGTQSTGNTSINNNLTVVSTYKLSPYLTGRLGDTSQYEARLTQTNVQATQVNAGQADYGTSTSDALGSLHFGSRADQVGLGWAIDTSQEQTSYSTAGSTSDYLLNFTLPYVFSPQFTMSVAAGREDNNYLTPDVESYATSGIGAIWTPSEATRIQGLLQHKSFGEAHSFSIDVRTARTAWRFSDTKDATIAPGLANAAGTGNIYDLLFAQFASIEPDPVARAQLVNNYLQANGLSANVSVNGGFVASTEALTRQQQLSFALLGIRDTFTLIASQGQTSSFNLDAQGVGDLSDGAVLNLTGNSAVYSHRLTPESSAGLSLSHQNTYGSLNLQNAALDTVRLDYSRQLSLKSILSLELRHVVSSGAANYDETAITCTLLVPL